MVSHNLTGNNLVRDFSLIFTLGYRVETKTTVALPVNPAGIGRYRRKSVSRETKTGGTVRNGRRRRSV
jgi:hypothetical protein